MTQADNVAIIKPQATSHKPQATQDSTLVSIIIPAYNTAPYIHRAIGSSLRQTHRNIEILIIDDGSTDDTLRVAEYFAGTDSRIRVFTQENAGVSAARNHGINEAKGEYIYFLDSDDWLEDDAIETLLDAQREHLDCLICSSFQSVRIKGNTLFRYSARRKIPSCSVTLKDIAEVYSGIQPEPSRFNNATGKFFRAPFTTRFSEGVIRAEDGVFFMTYFMQSGKKAYYISRKIVNVLMREGSATACKHKPESLDSAITAYKIIISVVDDEECKQLMQAGCNLQVFNILVQSIKYGADSQEIRRIISALQPSVWNVIKDRKYHLRKRLKLFLAVCTPVPVFKALVLLWIFLKPLIRKKNNSEIIIPDWQDFPKAPGIPV